MRVKCLQVKWCKETRKLPIDCLIVALGLDDFWRLNSVGWSMSILSHYVYVDDEAGKTDVLWGYWQSGWLNSLFFCWCSQGILVCRTGSMSCLLWPAQICHIRRVFPGLNEGFQCKYSLGPLQSRNLWSWGDHRGREADFQASSPWIWEHR